MVRLLLSGDVVLNNLYVRENLLVCLFFHFFDYFIKRSYTAKQLFQKQSLLWFLMFNMCVDITGGRSSTSDNGDIAIQWEWSNFDHS